MKLKIEPRVCENCGGKYIPTGTRQKFCPSCKESKNAIAYYKARQPGEVRRFTLAETPEDNMQQPETPERPALPEGWQEEQKKIDMPDGLAVIEEHAEILRRYYKGELVDKNEFLARIQEKLDEF